MRTTVAVALIAGVATAALAPAPAMAAKRKPLPNCAAKGSTTLAATETARVYELKSKRYACRYRKNRRVFLGVRDCDNDTAAGNFTLRGNLVGWEATSCGLVSGSQSIVVTDLNTGKRLRSAPAVTDATVTGNSERNTYVASYVMNATGSLAWIGVVNTDGTTTVDSASDAVQLRTLGPSSPAGGDLVDSGNDIGLDSLALAGSGQFYWQKGATPKSAPLP
jgi:hypothetical protein